MVLLILQAPVLLLLPLAFWFCEGEDTLTGAAKLRSLVLTCSERTPF